MSVRTVAEALHSLLTRIGREVPLARQVFVRRLTFSISGGPDEYALTARYILGTTDPTGRGILGFDTAGLPVKVGRASSTAAEELRPALLGSLAAPARLRVFQLRPGHTTWEGVELEFEFVWHPARTPKGSERVPYLILPQAVPLPVLYPEAADEQAAVPLPQLSLDGALPPELEVARLSGHDSASQGNGSSNGIFLQFVVTHGPCAVSAGSPRVCIAGAGLQRATATERHGVAGILRDTFAFAGDRFGFRPATDIVAFLEESTNLWLGLGICAVLPLEGYGVESSPYATKYGTIGRLVTGVWWGGAIRIVGDGAAEFMAGIGAAVGLELVARLEPSSYLEESVSRFRSAADHEPSGIASIALALYDNHRNGGAAWETLAALTRQAWGHRIGSRYIRQRLVEAGVQVP